MNLIPKNNSRIHKFQGGGPAYFKQYGINQNKFTSMFQALKRRGLSNQIAFEITWQSNKEVPKGYYSFGSRFSNVNDWADNVVNHQLNRSIYKNARNAKNFEQYRNATLPYNRAPSYTKWLLEGRDQGKGFINKHIEENSLGEPVVMMNFDTTEDPSQVLTARQGGIIKARTGWTAYFNPKNWGVSRYDTDDNGNQRTFNQAYGAARNAGEKEFLYNGKRYNVQYKHVLPPTEKQKLKTALSQQQYNLASDVWDYLMQNKVSPKNAAAIMGNIMQESSFIRNAIQKGGDKAQGLFQMHGDDLKAYNNWKTSNRTGKYPEIDYVLYMINSKDHPYSNEYKRVSKDPTQKDYVQKIYGDRIKNGRLYLIDDLNKAWNDKSVPLDRVTTLFTDTIERAGRPEYLKRTGYATDFYNHFHGIQK